jgi:hypothetical protein
MSLFSWLSKEVERGRQAARDEAQARIDLDDARQRIAVAKGEQWEKRRGEYERAMARGDSEAARKAERLMDLYS